MNDIPKLQSIEYLGGFVIRAVLTDGSMRQLDFVDQLDGPVMEPLRDEAVFRQGRVDDTGTLVWPNGVDISPEAWVDGWPEHAEPATARA